MSEQRHGFKPSHSSDKLLSRELSKTAILNKAVCQTVLTLVVPLIIYMRNLHPPADSSNVCCLTSTRPRIQVLMNGVCSFWSKSSVWNILQPTYFLLIPICLGWLEKKKGRKTGVMLVDQCLYDRPWGGRVGRCWSDSFWIKVTNLFLSKPELKEMRQCRWLALLWIAYIP